VPVCWAWAWRVAASQPEPERFRTREKSAGHPALFLVGNFYKLRFAFMGLAEEAERYIYVKQLDIKFISAFGT
jgi:hypothetical protein